MKVLRRALFWSLLAASAAAAGWWVWHVPYDPARLYRGLPANAAFVTAHRDVAGRWPALSATPFMQSLLATLGVEPEDLAEFSTDEQAQAWFRRLASDEAVLAYVPALRGYGPPAWVLGSWLGGRSQRFRWLLASGKIEGFRRLETYRGRPVWEIEDLDLDAGEHLCVALVEGILLACLSPDPGGIREILNAYDGLVPSLAMTGRLERYGYPLVAPDAEDRGWVNLPVFVEQPHRVSPLTYTFSALTPDRVAGRLEGRFAPAPAADPAQVEALLELGPVLGDLPLAAAAGTTGDLLRFLQAAGEVSGSVEVSSWLAAAGPAPVLAAVLGDPYSGRVFRLKLPMLLVAVRVGDEARALAAMEALLDQLNARHQLGLVPEVRPVGEHRVYVVESTSGDLFSAGSAQDRPAYATVGPWLLLSSHAGSLIRFMADRVLYPERREGGPGRWAAGLEAAPASLYTWFDLDRGGTSLRAILTLYSLKLLVSEPRRSQEARGRLDSAKAWLQALAPMEAARLWAEPPVGDVTTLNLRMGSDESF